MLPAIFASGCSALLEGSIGVALLLFAVAAATAAVVMKPGDPWRRGLGVVGAGLLLGALLSVVVSKPADRSSASAERIWPLPSVRGGVDGVPPDASEGFFPPRLARSCRIPALCATGTRPSINSLFFSGSAFPQSIRDERQFLLAKRIPAGEETPLTPETLSDPLWVSPGDRIRVVAIVDNAGARAEPDAVARGVRALLVLPVGSGTTHVLLTSISTTNADPPLVSDSLVIRSREPTYLRYEKGSASVQRPGAAGYRLTDALVSTYRPPVDRRRLAAGGVRLGCTRADGQIPGGRSCAFTYRATFEVRYAATSLNVNGLGRLKLAPFEVSGRLRSGSGATPLYWSPSWDSPTEYWVSDGTVAFLDCVIRRDGFTWYHLPDAEPNAGHRRRGFDTAFAPGSDVSLLRNTPPRCSR